jgi:hypothetical protein
MKAARFTYDEVKAALCDGCRLKVPDVHRDGNITHRLNGVSVPCTASAWRQNSEILDRVEHQKEEEA